MTGERTVFRVTGYRLGRSFTAEEIREASGAGILEAEVARCEEDLRRARRLEGRKIDALLLDDLEEEVLLVRVRFAATRSREARVEHVETRSSWIYLWGARVPVGDLADGSTFAVSDGRRARSFRLSRPSTGRVDLDEVLEPSA